MLLLIWLLLAPVCSQIIEVSHGQLPVVFAHPHDGTEVPVGWPDRQDGCVVAPSTAECSWGNACVNQTRDSSECSARKLRDAFTREVAQHAVTALWNLTGAYPSIVVNNARRSKLDANRAVDEAAQDFPPAVQAWQEYHAALENLTSAAAQGPCGSALLLDMHGQAHLHGWVEVGYSLSSSKLAASDASMDSDAATYQDRSTVRHAARTAATAAQPYPFTTLLRDTPALPTLPPPSSVSLGGLLELSGFPSVPSPIRPDPAGQSYFSGGYTSQRWSSRDAAPGSPLYRVDALQVEMPQWIRWGNASVQLQFGTAVGHAVFHWMQRNHHIVLAGGQACWLAPAPSAPPSASPSVPPSARVTSTPTPSLGSSSAPSASISAAPTAPGVHPGSSGTAEETPLDQALGIGAIVGLVLGSVALMGGAAAAWHFGLCRGGKQPIKAQGGGKYELSPPAADPARLVAHVSPMHPREP